MVLKDSFLFIKRYIIFLYENDDKNETSKNANIRMVINTRKVIVTIPCCIFYDHVWQLLNMMIDETNNQLFLGLSRTNIKLNL